MSSSTPYLQLLRRGRGLALLRASEARSAEHHEGVFAACSHFTGSDYQVDGGRAEYLFDVLVASGLREALEAPLLAALTDRTRWDQDQLLDLVSLFAVDGSEAAPRAIQDTFLRCVEQPDRPGAPQLVRVQGLAGMAVVARELGRVLPASGADWYDVHPLEVAELRFGADAATAELAAAASTDVSVRRYLEAVRLYREQVKVASQQPRTPSAPLTFEGLRAAALSNPRPPLATFRSWGLRADAAGLTAAADALAQGVEPVLRLAILKAFTQRPFPGAPEVILEALDCGDEEAVDAAWRALGQLASPLVRRRALAALGKTPPDLRALRALKRNFLTQDEGLLGRLLGALTEDEDVHAMGLTVLDLADDDGGLAVASLLASLYVHGACGHCRHEVVKHLHALGAAPRELLLECRYDANLELRADAASWCR